MTNQNTSSDTPRFSVSKDWITQSGLRAVIILNSMGYHCGYVEVPKDHKYFGLGYDDIPVEVHGGLTFSSVSTDYPVKTELETFWIGYDCGHYMDGKSPEWLASLPHDSYMRQREEDYPTGGIFRDLEYNINECESLAKQIVFDTI